MTDIASSDGYTPLLAPAPADDGDGPNVVQRSVAGRLWHAASNAVHQGADWVDHNSSPLTDMAGHGAETLLGGVATIAGGALIVSGAATCAASLPLAATGVGAILTAGACAAGAAEAAAGAAVAGAGIAAMVDGGSKFGHDLNRLERTGNPDGPEDNPRPTINKDFQFPGGGRSGGKVKDFVGPENSVVRGATKGRIFVTDEGGRVVLDITRERVKPVAPGRGFVRGDGRKVIPTQEQLAWIAELWG